MSLNNILAKPEFIDGVGNIYPVKIKDYDLFLDCAYGLYYSKSHFKDAEQYPLLDLVVYAAGDNKIVKNLEKVFSLVLRKEVFFVSNETQYGFVIDEKHSVTNLNYDQVRNVIMKQNIMHDQKVYKDPLVQQWAEKVMAARAKNSIKMSIEDMLTTVSVFKGVSYDALAEQTYYQLYADFQRITKLKSYDSAIQFKCAGAQDVHIEYFAEEVDMYKNPYDDLFKSKDKLKKLNSAMK